ncbi:RNA polymerase II transcription factor SIII subunit A-domain-containing protein [Aspergillus californicus]
MPAQTLRQLCTATAIRNVKFLNDIGNIPYALARPFLLKIESPEKLRALEIQSPHLMRDDAELWHEFIRRDIPKSDEISLPEQPDCWYDLYCELREEIQRAVDEDAEKLKMALDGISTERAKHSAKFVTDRRVVPLPRERPTAKQRYASFDRKMGGIKPAFSSKGGTGSSADPMGSPLWSFERPSAPRPQKKGNIFAAKKRNPALAVPTKQLNNRATQVRQAPRSLIEEHRRLPEPPVARRPSLRAPGRSSVPPTSNNRSQVVSPAVNSSLREREDRLRAIASGRNNTSSPSNNTAPQSSSTKRGLSSSRDSSEITPKPHPRLTSTANSEDYRSSESGTNTDPDDSRMSPPRAVIRKRPAANVFIQPKKKRLT